MAFAVGFGDVEGSATDVDVSGGTGAGELVGSGRAVFADNVGTAVGTGAGELVGSGRAMFPDDVETAVGSKVGGFADPRWQPDNPSATSNAKVNNRYTVRCRLIATSIASIHRLV